MTCERCGAATAVAARFCSACGASIRPAEAAGDTERRQVTVVFCDLVGSTELSQRLDAEDYGDIIAWYHDLCDRIIEANGGYVDQHLGDGVLAFFGHDRSREDDAWRSVRSGLGVLESLRQEQSRFEPLGVELMARIGIHTGRVVIKGAAERGQREPLAMGDAPNIAARIQAEAGPGGLLVSDVTWSIVRREFAAEDLGPRKLKGVDGPMRLWRVSGAANREPSGRAWTAEPDFVGRADELSALAAAWKHVQQSSAQFVLVRGEPGIGKSRLVDRFVEDVNGSARVLVLQAHEQDRNTPFRPVIDLIADELDLKPTSAPAELAHRFREALAAFDIDDSNEVAYLSRLVSGDTGKGGPQPDPVLGAERAGGIDLLVRLLTDVATREPTVLVGADLHWADASTVQLLGALVEAPPGPRLCSASWPARPEFAPPWAGRAEVVNVELAPLDRAETEALVRAVASGKALPGHVTRQIDRQSGRVPLFVQELTRSVIDSGALQARGASWEASRPLPVADVPSTVDAVLTSRIDRLGPARPTALLAATIGGHFTLDLLDVVSTRDRPALLEDLDQLVRAGIAVAEDADRQAYAFSHALLQDAAYGLLLRGTRHRYHSAIAAALLESSADETAVRPELIARHLSLAGRHDEAVGYWEAASRQASAQACYSEATDSLQRALSCLMQTEPGPERDGRELALQSLMGPLCMTVYGWGSREVDDAVARALVLAERLERPLDLCGLLWGSWSVRLLQGDMDRALVAATRLQDAVRNTAPFLATIGHNAMALTLAHRADFVRLLAETDAGLAGCSPEVDRQFIESTSIGPSVGLRTCKAIALWMDGRVKESDDLWAEMLVTARALDHRPSLAAALVYTLQAGCFRSSYNGDLRHLLAISDELSALCEEFYFWAAANLACRGVIQRSLGDRDEARRCMLEGLELFEQTGARCGFVHMAVFCAEAFGRMGADAEATRLLAAAEHDVTLRNEGLFAPDVWRLRGAIAARAGDPTGAAALYREAIARARAQHARPLELRAALDLHDLLSRTDGAPGAVGDLAAAVAGLSASPSLPEIDRALTIVGDMSPTS